MKLLTLKRSSVLFLISVVLLTAFNNCGQFEVLGNLTGQQDLSSGSGKGPALESVGEESRPPNPNMSLLCDSTVVRGASNSSSRKLTKIELLNAIKDLTNNHPQFSNILTEQDFTYVPPDRQDPLQVAVNDYPGEYSKIPGEDFEKLHGREQLQAWMDVVEAFADKFQSNELHKLYLSEPCIASSVLTPACLNDFTAKFGRKVYRRPLTADELKTYQAMFGTSDFGVSLRKIIARMLRSPYFVFQLESGIRDDGNRVRLSDYEVASRISFATIGSIPDDALSAAADAGELKTLKQTSAHAERLLASPRGQVKMREFFSGWLRLNEVTVPNTMWANFAMLLDFRNESSILYNSNRMDVSYREEAQDFLHGIIWDKKGTFRDLMTAPVAYPRDIRTAKVYGVNLNANEYNDFSLILDGSERSAPNNPGLLTRAALLSSSATNPNAIMRGVNVKRRILCDEIPAPNFSIVADRVSDLEILDPTHSHFPNHELITKLTSSSSCISCHSQINPMGYLFEGYNPLGQKSGTQKIIANEYEFLTKYADHMKPRPTNLPEGVSVAVLEEYALPGTQNGLYIEAGLPTSFQNSDDLIKSISISRKARACMQVRLFRHFYRRAETKNDACALAEATEILKRDEPIINSMVRTIANEDIFWGKAK